jgi:hypothetical protein
LWTSLNATTDHRFALTQAFLRLVAQPADERHGIGLEPPATGRQPAQSVGRLRGALAKHDRVVDDADVEAVSGLDPEPTPGVAWYGDLVLGADLDA